MILAGKDAPAGTKFADGLADSGRFVAVTKADSENDTDAGQRQQKLLGKASGVAEIPWNKSSPISAKTLLLTTESIFGKADEAVLYFDEEFYASKANSLTIEECAKTADSLILSFQYLALELLARFEHAFSSNGEKKSLVFLLKDGPSVSDAAKIPGLRSGTYAIASPVIAAAAAAFAAFAENLASLYSDSTFVNIILARGDRSSDIVSSELQLAKWLSDYLDSAENHKKSGQWVKIGAKITPPPAPQQTSGFSFFGRRKEKKQ